VGDHRSATSPRNLAGLLPPRLRKAFYRKTLQDVVIGVGMVTVGWLVARLHLHAFDHWFLRQGRLARLMSK